MRVVQLYKGVYSCTPTPLRRGTDTPWTIRTSRKFASRDTLRCALYLPTPDARLSNSDAVDSPPTALTYTEGKPHETTALQTHIHTPSHTSSNPLHTRQWKTVEVGGDRVSDTA